MTHKEKQERYDALRREVLHQLAYARRPMLDDEICRKAGAVTRGERQVVNRLLGRLVRLGFVRGVWRGDNYRGVEVNL